MVAPMYYLCDICGEKVDIACRLHVVTHQVLAGAYSDEPVDQGETVDLCPFHMSLMVKWLLTTRTMAPQTNYAAGKLFMHQIKQLQGADKK